MGKTSSKVNNRYKEKAYDRISIIVPKGTKTALQELANDMGVSVNNLLTEKQLKCAALRLILKDYWKNNENYSGSIIVKIISEYDNRNHFTAETDGNDFEICQYDDGTVFIRLRGAVGDWKNIDGQFALIIDDVPFISQL